MDKKCNTCACNAVCKYKESNDSNYCENWINKDETMSPFAKKQIIPTMLMIENALTMGNEERAGTLIDQELDSNMKYLQSILENRFKCDWPFVLAAMKSFAQYHLDQMSEESRSIAAAVENGVRFYSINIAPST